MCTSHDADAVQRGVVVSADEVVGAPWLQANVPNVAKVGHLRRLGAGRDISGEDGSVQRPDLHLRRPTAAASRSWSLPKLP